MSDTENNNIDTLSADDPAEFISALSESVLILTTSSPDKRDIYRTLFSILGKEKTADGKEFLAGVKLAFTDSGALGIAPRKTGEMTNDYGGNLNEKTRLLMDTLNNRETQRLIGLQLDAVPNKPWTRNKLVGMTEDSGWQLDFENPDIQRQFIDMITEKMRPKIRQEDDWLLKELHKTSFPGPNLKPLQEHLEGGFNELMEMIYDTADALHIKKLRFTNSINIAFAIPHLNKTFSLVRSSSGDVLTRGEYNEQLVKTEKGMAINSNFVHVPDGQKDGERKTIAELIRDGLYTLSSKDLPGSYARRDAVETLQQLIGKRRSFPEERSRFVNLAHAHPRTINDHAAHIEYSMPVINDLRNVRIASAAQLLKSPDHRHFDRADVILAIPEDSPPNGDDPNLRMLINLSVVSLIDPESMGVARVVDNRTGKFNSALALFSDAFAQGRMVGDMPFQIANSSDELRTILTTIKDIKQRALIIKTPSNHDTASHKPLPRAVPADGTFTIFIAGGHATNSGKDMKEAQEFGYYCAQQGWRIITGAGSIEGSMGALHTGFIQYHLDQFQKLQESANPEFDSLKGQLKKYINGGNKLNAERIILEKPQLIDDLADAGFIPRDMFYGYSTNALLEMESPSGKAPPGITYGDAGNLTRRMARLLAAGTKIFMPGSIGTDQEFVETIHQHLEARSRKKATGAANDHVFADGTPDEEGTMIVYNRNHNLDKLLGHYGILGNDPVAAAKRNKYNIHVVESPEDLQKAVAEHAVKADSWLEKIRNRHKKPSEGQGTARATA